MTARIEWIEKYLNEAERMMYDNTPEQGFELMNRLLYDEPGYGSLHNHLGWAYLYYSAETEKAELHLKCAIAFASEFAPPYQHLGALYSRLNKHDEAIEILQKGLNKPGANKTAMLEGIASAYELKKEYGHAIKHYKEAIVSTAADCTKLTSDIKRCRRKILRAFIPFL